MLFYAVALYIPLIISGNILCGSYKPLDHFGVCTCTTFEDGQLIQADCTKHSWLQQLPSFAMDILQLMTSIDMSGTVFCRNATVRTTVHNKTILCLDRASGE